MISVKYLSQSLDDSSKTFTDNFLSGHHGPGLLRPAPVPGLAPAGPPHRPPVAVSLHQGQALSIYQQKTISKTVK